MSLISYRGKRLDHSILTIHMSGLLWTLEQGIRAGFRARNDATVVVNTQDKLHLRSRSSVFETSC